MTGSATPYRVLARKYRPVNFAEVIGQEAMVRTLSNAIAAGRIAHAFILTGVRGVGKTTTARILARALNCVGPDGTGGPTIAPCGVCDSCRAIAEDRHVDVMEMDAASRTGVDDIRELTEGVRYRPVSARYKVYIIDEVHMLSKNAFNALLKTLEEPPGDVKFVFATTEIHKVPVTVLSRCQRFSLRRVPVDLLIGHYRRVAEAENTAIEPGALGLIARAADGSVRDGLSILDQAIALSDGSVGEAAVRDMLGIADRGRVFELLETVLRGDAAAALGQMDDLYQGGADPLMVLQDLLDLTHFLTRLKLVADAGAGDPLAEGDRERARPLAAALTLPVLARAWQMLLKGVTEVQTAPTPSQAAEMVLIRLAYVADLPAPAELARTLTAGSTSAAPMPSRGALDGLAPDGLASGGSSNGGETIVAGSARVGAGVPPGPRPLSPVAQQAGAQQAGAQQAGAPTMRMERGGRTAAAPMLAAPAPDQAPDAETDLEPLPQSFAEIVDLFEKKREAMLRVHLREQLHLVAFEPGHIEFRPAAGAPRDLANRLGQLLGEWTGTRWVVAVSAAAGEPTIREQEESRDRRIRNELAEHPLVRAVLETFPGATIAAVRERFASADATLTADEAEPSAADDGDDDDETNTGEDRT